MNLLHLKYAVEIDRTKSISRAAEVLYMGQPNLSRAIKELEDNLGIKIFRRTSKGIITTTEGEEFLEYARKITSQVDELENIYKKGKKGRQKLSVCVPRASYISYALAEFSKKINRDLPATIFYKETNSMQTINSLITNECNLGIIRFQALFDKYFKALFSEKKLAHETITEFNYVLITSKDSPLAQMNEITFESLSDYIEITHSDSYVPSLSQTDVLKAEFSETVDKRIFLFERASQFVVLENDPNTFMWVSPIPQPLLDKHHLVQIQCKSNSRMYKDVLVYRKGHKLTNPEREFMEQVYKANKKYQED